MADLHDFDLEFLDELSKKAVDDPHVEVMLLVIEEMNNALHEKREVRMEYQPMLAMLLAARGASELDVIRFVSAVKLRDL